MLGIPLSRHTALRLLLQLPLPEVSVPKVLGAGDFALRRGQVCATVLIDATTGERVDVLAGRKAEVLETWLHEHPGIEVVCRDGSGAYGEAVRRALPGAVQAGDRWHLSRPGRSRAEGGRRAQFLLGRRRATAERGQASPDDRGAVAAGP